MKKFFEAPEMEVVKFAVMDVVTVSGEIEGPDVQDPDTLPLD